MISLNTKQKIILASISYKVIHLARKLSGKSDQVFLKRNGINWHLELNEGIDFSIYLLGGFEPTTLNLYLKLLRDKPGQVVFDIGANVGSHTLPLAKIVASRGGRVYAFEPTKWAFEKLQRNVDANPDLKKSIIIEQAMIVADQDAILSEEIYSSWPLSDQKDVHTIHRGKLKTTAGAKAFSLDYFIQSNRIEKVDFIKMDVDGHEGEVLNGAKQSIEKFHPDILMEWSPSLKSSSTHENMLTWLLALGYHLYDGFSGKPIHGGIATLAAMTPEHGSINILVSMSEFLNLNNGKKGKS